MKIALELQGHYSNSGPFCLIEVNNQILHRGILEQGDNVLEFEIQPLDLNTLRIHHMLKSNEILLLILTGISQQIRQLNLHRCLLKKSKF